MGLIQVVCFSSSKYDVATTSNDHERSLIMPRWYRIVVRFQREIDVQHRDFSNES